MAERTQFEYSVNIDEIQQAYYIASQTRKYKNIEALCKKPKKHATTSKIKNQKRWIKIYHQKYPLFSKLFELLIEKQIYQAKEKWEYSEYINSIAYNSFANIKI